MLQIHHGKRTMKVIRNMSMKWKVILPIAILSFLLFATCLQSNIANDRMLQSSAQIALSLGEVTPEVREMLEAQNKLCEGMKSSNMVKMIIAVLATVLIVLVSSVGVLKPTIKMNEKIQEIIEGIDAGKGDLTQRVDVRGKDEIGQLSAGINSFLETLQNIMHQVTVNSNKLQSLTSEVSERIRNVNGNSSDISSSMQELNAAMEEISASILNIRESTKVADDRVNELAENTDGLVSYADTMERRAADLERKAVENKQNTGLVVEDNIAKWQQATDESKKVEKINELTNEILQISRQTIFLR